MRPSGRPRSPPKSTAEGVSRFRPGRGTWHEPPVGGSRPHPGRYRGRSYKPVEGRGHGIGLGMGRTVSAAYGRRLVAFRAHPGAGGYGKSRTSRPIGKASEPPSVTVETAPGGGRTASERKGNDPNVPEIPSRGRIPVRNTPIRRFRLPCFLASFVSFYLRFLVSRLVGVSEPFYPRKHRKKRAAGV